MTPNYFFKISIKQNYINTLYTKKQEQFVNLLYIYDFFIQNVSFFIFLCKKSVTVPLLRWFLLRIHRCPARFFRIRDPRRFPPLPARNP